MSGSAGFNVTRGVAYLGPKYSYSHLAAVANLVKPRPRARGLDRRRLRRSQSQPRRFRPGSAGELDRRPHRRHARYVHQAAEPEDPRRSSAAHSPLPAGQVRGARFAGSTPSRRHLAVPQLAGQEPAASGQIEVVSTAAAAQLAQREEFAAAVASRAAGAYGLDVLAENIEDQPIT